MITREIKANTPTQVKSTIIGVQIVEDEYNCEVAFSISGDEFTAMDKILTEANNVICNIPRSVYLQFSQDVVITEE